MRLRVTVIGLLAAFVALALPPGAPHALAANPTIAMTLGVSPNPAAPGAPQVFTGTITPTSGSPTNVRVTMEGAPSGGSCQPEAYCSVFYGRAEWVFPTVTSKITVTFTVPSLSYRTVHFFNISDAVGCTGTCPPSVYTQPATTTASLAYQPLGAVLTGDVLHVTVKGRTDAGPILGNLHVNLPMGVDAPTSLPDGAIYSPAPSHYIDMAQTLNPDAEYSFDVRVNAATGSSLAFESYFYPVDYSVNTVPGSLTIKVGPDSVPPVVSAPKQAFVAGSTLSSRKVPVRLTWTGSDALSGVARYELSQRTDWGSWTIVSTSLPSTTTTRYLSVSHSYRFRVRAVDRAGNSSPWAYSSTFRVSAYQDSNTNLRYAGTWGLSTNSIWWNGKARFASRSGATVRLTFTGRSFAWVGLRSPYRGRAQVYVNGVLKATVDLKAATTQTGRLVWAANWSSSATRTVLIKVLGTSGRPRVDIDGFATIR